MQIPQSQILTTRHLNRVFDKTVATYKYYWFLGILDLYVKQGNTRMRLLKFLSLVVKYYPCQGHGTNFFTCSLDNCIETGYIPFVIY